jgi:uncharacterized protein (UPF0332 family)
MTPDQLDLLRKAQSSLEAARLLLKGSYPDFAASRAYYAMFYVAEAFLEGDGLAYSKHSAVIAGFGQHFAKTGRVPVELHRFLLEAQEMRNASDYGALHAVTAAQAEVQVSRAEQFLEQAERLLGPIPPGEASEFETSAFDDE